MKRALIVLCLFSSVIVNAQTIKWDKFDEKKLNREVFDMLDRKRDYSFVNFPEVKKVDRYMWWNFNKISIGKMKRLTTNELVVKLNQDILKKSIAIIDSISCEGFKTYEDLARKCVKDWDNPSDMFGMEGFITITSYYKYKTNTLYVVGLVKSYTAD